MCIRSIRLTVIIAYIAVIYSSCSKGDDKLSLTPLFNPAVTYGTLTDQDNVTYKTVNIGTQTWMAENLRTTKYNDGTSIPNITEDTEWIGLSTGAYCNYNNTTSEDTITANGRLYNFYAVETNKLCPQGWHVPTDAEWKILIDYSGGNEYAGKKLKERGYTHWQYVVNIDGQNNYGFTALPCGNRDSNYQAFGISGNWWSTTEFEYFSAWYSILISFYSDCIFRNIGPKASGKSVRCLKN
jgi:uncharacterized protein (TIGR02145 family)